SLLSDQVDVVVVSTAVRADNPEVLEARRRGIPVIHRAAALAGLLAGRELVAVAGTHGKTSTTGMAVMALRGAGADPAWALGAAVPDLGRNAGFAALPAPMPGGAAAARPGRGIAVVEADESDGSFLAFTPRSLVVTNLEADHLDFHGDPVTLTAAFDTLTGQLETDATLVVCADDPGARARTAQLATDAPLVVCADDPGARALGERAARTGTAVISYGAAADASWRITAERSGASGTEVEVDTPHGPLRLELAVAGHHNVL